MSEKVLYTDIELSIHEVTGDPYDLPNGKTAEPVVARTLLPGQFVELSKLASYQREAAQSGELTGGKVVTKAQAKSLAEKYATEDDVVPEPENVTTDYDAGIGEEETPESDVVVELNDDTTSAKEMQKEQTGSVKTEDEVESEAKAQEGTDKAKSE